MTRASVTRIIAAPVGRVFETIADIENFKRAIPHIIRVEFLSESRKGIGTRFRETRLIKGKESTTELEVTDYVANERLRMVADSHGTIWNSLFALKEVPEGTALRMTMEARAYQMVAKLMNPMVVPLVRGALEEDLDLVKRYCEEPPGPTV